MSTVTVPDRADHWLILPGSAVTVAVDQDLSVSVYQGGKLAWQSMTSSTPVARVAAEDKKEPITVALSEATERVVKDFADGTHRGRYVRLRGFSGVDVELALVVAIDDTGELLVQVEQTGGEDTVQRVGGLYDWQLTPAPDAYVLVPRGSGYMIRADQPDRADAGGFIGTAWTLPLFAVVKGDQSLYQIVETWWDAHVSVSHTPGKSTVLSLDWEPSLGKLSYTRRVLIRFGQNVDHVEMAKGYRKYLIDRGEFKTLKQRVETLPVLAKYLAGVEFRWGHFGENQTDTILTTIRNFQDAGLPISFFYPKWPSQGVDKSKSFDAGWQGYLHPSPMYGGWPAAVELLNAVHEVGCTAKVMMTAHVYHSNAPAYDPAKASGINHMPRISDHYAEWLINAVFDHLKQQNFKIDAMYFDGSSAYGGHGEHQGRSRREGFEAQLAQFRETRRRGVIPGAELARHWSIAECDFFFFTDWSSDRLRHGEPVPLVPLVFHDCYGAQFSGGGYYGEGKYDWYQDRHPRLYELMYAAIPSHNWLPGGSRRIKPEDWNTDKMARRLKWLKKWHTYYQKICYEEMTSHQFLNEDRTLQRVEFANGVVVDFNLEKGLLRVKGVEGFTGDWEEPQKVKR